MAGIKVCQHKIFKISTEHLQERLVNENNSFKKGIRNIEKEGILNELSVEDIQQNVEDYIKKQKEESNIDEDKNEISNWSLNITKEEAEINGELISLFDSQMFRLINQILIERNVDNPNFNVEEIDYTKYVFSLIIGKNKDDFQYVIENGFVVNDISFKRFVGTTGGLKQNCVLFVSEDIIDELNERTTSRTNNVPLVPAKYEAYKALTCSSSQQIAEPNGILVVPDCLIKYKDTIIQLDDTIETDDGEPKKEVLVDVELENNATDGFNLCTLEYMQKCCNELGIDYVSGGLCLRNKWLKGMMYPFPIKEFVSEYGEGKTVVKDIWGNDIDINKVDLILTESSLKLWSSYNSIDDYVNNYKKSGYKFSVTKIAPNVLENERTLNYQYLQSYKFEDEDIEELCKPTVDFLRNSMGNKYEDVIKFLGIGDTTNDYGWQHALKVNPYMLNDPYIIDNIHRFIKRQIEEAKIGKIICNGNFQIFSNDPFCLMESIFKDNEQVKGLLKEGQVYSSYWNEVKNPPSYILAFRSPMTCHNNIRKLECVNNEETKKWYKYMKNIFIVNSFDSFCKAENGEDADGDQNFSTDNKILLKKFVETPAISCIQKSAKKFDIDEQKLYESNMMAFGNDVGTITNYVTSMLEVQSRFDNCSEEYKMLEYRIQCGQLYQQNCLDSIKGIVAKPMPKYWSAKNECIKRDNEGNVLIDEKGNPIVDEYNLSLCANNKPYFMIYRYEDEKKKYNKYIDSNSIKCIQLFGISLKELLEEENDKLSDEKREFIKWYYKKLPVGIGNCAMNRICWHIENSMDGYKSTLKKNKSKFDYTLIKYKRNETKKYLQEYKKVEFLIEEICKIYIHKIAEFKKNSYNATTDKEDSIKNRNELKKWATNKVKDTCKDNQIIHNVILDLCYGKKNMNKQFCWDTIGKTIIERLEILNNGKNNN